MTTGRTPPALDVDALLDDPRTKIIVCCGSGGVGKTTTAAALGVRAAERGRDVVVLTVDPARRLAQSMGLSELDNNPRRIEIDGDGELHAMMLDMKRTFDEIVEAHADPDRARQILANPFYQSLSSSLSGTQEYMAMEKLGQLHRSGAWDLIIVDTPPSRNALDFLDAPERMGRFLDGRFMKILAAPDAGRALWMLVALGLFFIVFPELKGADRLLQAKRGAPTLLDHSIQAAARVAGPPLLRLAALFHDVGKLHTRRVAAGGRVVFHGHEKASAEVCRRAMRRLRFSRAEIERVASLVEMHMALAQPVTKKTLRRWVDRFGEEWVRELLILGRADAEASGFGEENPHIDHLEEALREIEAERGAFSRRHLKVDGRDVMRELGIPPGPLVGAVLEKVYDAVLDDPSLNERETLLALVRRLSAEEAGRLEGKADPKPNPRGE